MLRFLRIVAEFLGDLDPFFCRFVERVLRPQAGRDAFRDRTAQGVAIFTRIMRSSTLDVLGQDYVRTARSKGVPEHVVNSRHVARIALIPILTLIGFSLAGLLGGAFIVELIFGIPGVGRFTLDALFARDFPVIMAISLIGAASLVMANLIVDILYSIVAPRIRYQ